MCIRVPRCGVSRFLAVWWLVRNSVLVTASFSMWLFRNLSCRPLGWAVADRSLRASVWTSRLGLVKSRFSWARKVVRLVVSWIGRVAFFATLFFLTYCSEEMAVLLGLDT